MWIDYTTPEQLPQLKALWHTAFGDSTEFIDNFFHTGYAPSRSRCVVENGRVLSVLYWLDCFYAGQKMAYLYAIATHPDHQGKGLFRKLSEDTRRLLTEQGYTAELLMPGSEALRQMYARLGYRDTCFCTEEKSPAGPGSIAAPKPLSAAQYGALRGRFLPPDGAVQPAENLDYLATYAEFYTGENYLLAAVREENTLFGLEFLGDNTAIPGILSALNCESGKFRMPGNEVPTAMSRPLTASANLPKYLGFLFD